MMSAGRSVVISVVIFTRDDAAWLARCLGALQASPPTAPLEVIVFDNASQDGTAALVRSWRDRHGRAARLLRSDTDTSFSRGNNLGLELATGRHVVFLNPDTEVPGAVLDRCSEALDRHGDIGLIGPRLRFEGGDVQPNGWALPTAGQLIAERLRGIAREVPTRGPLTDVGWLMGCFLMGRADDLRALGGFDERVWFHGTDLELCARVADDGWRIVRADDVEIVHRGHRDWPPARRTASRRATLRWLVRRAVEPR